MRTRASEVELEMLVIGVGVFEVTFEDHGLWHDQFSGLEAGECKNEQREGSEEADEAEGGSGEHGDGFNGRGEGGQARNVPADREGGGRRGGIDCDHGAKELRMGQMWEGRQGCQRSRGWRGFLKRTGMFTFILRGDGGLLETSEDAGATLFLGGTALGEREVGNTGLALLGGA